MFFFIHWSSETKKRNIGANNLYCETCQRITLQNYRMNEQIVKVYWFLPIFTKRKVTQICNNCLREHRLEKSNEKMIVRVFLDNVENNQRSR